ncbi:MAG: hypothetical protein EP319_18645 [Deltaproteobacteria bacterium]|nr:MAG: hypothetical protein EP319_18645 [Deltaproteobacteria bacterium]
MKKGIFIFLILTSQTFASQAEIDTCNSQAELYGQPSGGSMIGSNCYDLFNSNATLKNKDISEDGNLEIFGMDRIIFTRWFDGTLTHKYNHAGDQTRLDGTIHHLHLDTTNNMILGLIGETKAIYSWKVNQGGNIAPTGRLTNTTNLDSASAVSLDEANNQLIVIHSSEARLSFYNRLACVDGKTTEHQTDIKRTLAGGATQMISPVDAAVSVSRNELYVLDSNLNKILVFASNASGDVAPIRSINVTGLGTVVKVDYRATADKLRVTDSVGATADFNP